MQKTKRAGMKRGRTPWLAKLRPGMEPEITRDRRGRGEMLLPTPMLVAAEIATIPRGSLRTLSELRLQLARRFHADLTCPLMTGIFYNLIAGAAEETLQAGQ